MENPKINVLDIKTDLDTLILKMEVYAAQESDRHALFADTIAPPKTQKTLTQAVGDILGTLGPECDVPEELILNKSLEILESKALQLNLFNKMLTDIKNVKQSLTEINNPVDFPE